MIPTPETRAADTRRWKANCEAMMRRALMKLAAQRGWTYEDAQTRIKAITRQPKESR